MASVKVITEKCTGCKKCVNCCPYQAILVEDKLAIINHDKCTLCGACIEQCKFAALELNATKSTVINIDDYQGVWVFCEQYEGQVKTVAYELLAQGKEIAKQLETELFALVLGSDIADVADDLFAYGADKVILVDEIQFAKLNDMLYTDTIVKLTEQCRPAIILLGATSFGRSLAPRVAARLGTGLTADCTILDIDKSQGLLLQTRPAFGGNIMATIITPNHRPQMATVRPRVFKPLEADYSRKGQIIRPKIETPTASPVDILEIITNAADNINIGEVDILVAVGRGIGSINNIALAEELAGLLNGALAVSRPLVDMGWYAYSHQVGQTGKTVAPKLYIAIGISGAIQHMVGVAAETIIAVNTDPDAPIFNYAHYAIKGDSLDFLYAMIEQLKARQN